MEETTPPERASSALVVGFSLVSLLVRGGGCGELVLPSLPPQVRRIKEREELVCGTMLKGKQSSPAEAVSVGSWGGEELFKVENSVCAEPHLEVDTEEEPHEGIEETGQT